MEKITRSQKKRMSPLDIYVAGKKYQISTELGIENTEPYMISEYEGNILTGKSDIVLRHLERYIRGF